MPALPSRDAAQTRPTRLTPGAHHQEHQHVEPFQPRHPRPSRGDPPAAAPLARFPTFRGSAEATLVRASGGLRPERGTSLQPRAPPRRTQRGRTARAERSAHKGTNRAGGGGGPQLPQSSSSQGYCWPHTLHSVALKKLVSFLGIFLCSESQLLIVEG